MNISEVSVDLDGRLVAPGQIVFATDPTGHFVGHRHSHLRISPRETNIRLVGAKVWRDSSSFLVVEEIPPVVFLPPSLSLIMQNALEQTAREVHAMLTHQEGRADQGRIDSESTPAAGRSRQLSDWTIDITANGENLRFEISAARPQPKVTIKFDVNAATRVAMFGAPLLGVSDDILSDQVPNPATTAASLSLGNAPVSRRGEIFGYASDGVWIKISEFGSQLCLDRCRPPDRLANGFLSAIPPPLWPRLWIRGLNMTQLIDVLHGDNKNACIAFRGGYFGHAEWGPFVESASGAMSIWFTRAQLGLRLIDGGVELSYDVTGLADTFPYDSEGLSGVFVIPWEILILRYPQIGCINPRAKKHRL